MQSSCKLIKRGFAKEGDSKIISTEYKIKKPMFEEFEAETEEEEEEKAPQIDPEELLKKYEDIGKRIIEDAKREKQAIALRGEMEANAAEKAAYEKGYEQGLKNGYEDGHRKAYDETIEVAKIEASEIINKAETLLKSAHENYENYLEVKRVDIIKLALEIAEGITKRELSKDKGMNELIEEAFKISKGEDNIIIKTNSVHVKEIKAEIERWKIAYSIKNEIFVIIDENIEPGNAILEKPSGLVKVGVEIGMEQIRKAILG